MKGYDVGHADVRVQTALTMYPARATSGKANAAG